ncbi:Aste57867_25541 [Aphanomyces stellatus]|uniref:Aste57867_25541 protein n=1 Tax=Aphanomyces stellatus TaxID=120398 RepID=A0A485LTH1_9STRA|nr:hypothetical protein As57867_025462 [Aphanomyces stellatus]VFU02164.1 Aste57867_25541 [Aphanomyces stellatus]
MCASLTTLPGAAAYGAIELPRGVLFAIAWVLTWLTSGGLVMGFGPLYSRLVDEQQWHDLCPANATSVCSAQEVQLQSVYSTGLLMTVLAQAIFGALLDTIGPRYMTTGAYLFSIAGNVCMAYGDSHNGTDGLLVAGFALIGFGGMGILYASLQLSELFHEPALYTSIMLAAYSISGYIYVFLALDVTRKAFFLGYAILSALAMVIGFLVFPIHHIQTVRERVTTSGLSLARPNIDMPKLRRLWAGLKLQLRRRDFWFYVILGSLVFLVLVYAGGAIPSIVTTHAKNNFVLKDRYTNYLYPLVSNTSFLFTPLGGYLIFQFGFKATCYVTITFFALLCGSFMLPTLGSMNLAFALMAITYGLMSTIQYVYIMHCFPHELYGLLAGLATLLVFIYCLLSYALTALVQYSFDGNSNYAFLILFCTTMLAYFTVPYLREETDYVADPTLHFDSSPPPLNGFEHEDGDAAPDSIIKSSAVEILTPR